MNVVYHLTSPPPVFPGADAVFQEVELLRRRFAGEAVQLYPLRHPSRWFPRRFYGLHCRSRLRQADGVADLHHVFYAELYPFPALRALRRPVIYSVVAGLDAGRRPPARALDSVRHVVVSNERDRDILASWGISNQTLIRPGIDLSRFTPTPPPPGPDFTLLAGSAPWVRRQFRDKGIDAMLSAVRRIPRLRLVLLWRGRLYDSLMRRVRRLGVEDRVEVVNGSASVNDVLARVHAAIVLADSPRIVKAYPHSLLEALAAGRPVLVSEAIPMADYVRQTDCGAVVDGLDASALERAIERLQSDYPRLQQNALTVGRRDFSAEAMLAAHGKLYGEMAGRAP
jgi:glycosyltransferase involved in cell wall biosynthesis